MDPALQEIGGHNQFEGFATAYLKALGYKVEILPGEGPDGGRDLIVVEDLPMKSGDLIEFRWLVSCKYWSSAVNPGEEEDVIGRLQQHGCNGFMGFYSTWPTSGLTNKLDGMKGTPVSQIHMFKVQFINGYDIMAKIASESVLWPVAEGRMPKYYKKNIKPKISSDIARGVES